MKRFNYGNEKGILVIKDSHEDEYRMTMPDDVAYVVALLNALDKALADRDATIAEMREALAWADGLLTAINDQMPELPLVSDPRFSMVMNTVNAILAKYPQKGR